MQPPADVNYTFSAAEIDLIRPYGEVRAHKKGARLIAEGDRQADLLVTLSGETHIVVPTKDGPTLVGWMEAGQFTGDVGVLAGQATLATTTMGAAGEVLHVPYENLLRLLAECPPIDRSPPAPWASLRTSPERALLRLRSFAFTLRQG